MNTEPAATDRNRSSLSGERGFTLIEGIFSLALLTVIMLLTVKLMMSEIRGNHAGKLYTKTTSMAADMVEKLMEVDYSDLVEFDNYNTSLTPPGVEPAHSYCGEWRQMILDEIPGGYGEIDVQYGSNLSSITVTIHFKDDDVVHEVKLETMRNNVL